MTEIPITLKYVIFISKKVVSFWKNFVIHVIGKEHKVYFVRYECSPSEIHMQYIYRFIHETHNFLGVKISCGINTWDTFPRDNLRII